MNASILLLTIYLLVPKITHANMIYFHKVLKTFNFHLSHKFKFTKVTGNTLRIHFLIDHTGFRYSLLYYVLLILLVARHTM